ncbi:MAG: iron-containing alcohol dehydrogenase [Clostridia bacterium]|nr:iron-containing alcohol dehydrogenase [Clostridia bacterium]
MTNINTYMPVEVISGKDCVKTFDRYNSLGEKCAIITGKNMYKKCSVIDDLKEALTKNGVSYVLICEAENNPTPQNVFSMAKKAVDFGADFIIGVGGGSSMDAAKAASLVITNDGVTEDNIFKYDFKNKPLPSIMIGTTAGTGSEVMPSAVLTIPGKKYTIKKGLKTRDSYAVFALCDPQYTYTLPEDYTVSTALDSICHAIEAMYSKKANDFTPIYAQKALKCVMASLKELKETAAITPKMRDDFYYGSIMAGMALNNGGTSCAHSLGYLLTTMHDIPHGFACAAFIGEFLKRCSAVFDISDTLASLGFETVEEFNCFVKDLNCKYSKIPTLTEEQVSAYAEEGSLLNVNNNHLNITIDDCKEFYRNI